MVDRMIACVPSLSGRILDLCAGDGAFVRGLLKVGVDPANITTVEIDPQFKNVLESYGVEVLIGDYKAVLADKSGQYDVVFSNPPYQIMDGGFKASAKPIYHEIVMYTIDILKPQYVCMITPSRWMAGGKGLDDYRARMLKDRHIRLIQDFPGAQEVFETVFLAGGVSFFLWDCDYNGLCEFNGIQRDIGEFNVLIRNNIAHQILKKVLTKHDGSFCNWRVLPRKQFGISTDFCDWKEPDSGTVKCLTKGRKEKYVSFGQFTDEHGVQSRWKVCTPKGYKPASEFDDNNPLYVLNSFVVEPGTISTETYIVIGSFNTQKEAEAYLAYANTKFYRFMVSLRKISQDVNREKFSWVPDLNDYSKEWTDEELYAHFELTKKEIEHIEKTIKEAYETYIPTNPDYRL